MPNCLPGVPRPSSPETARLEPIWQKDKLVDSSRNKTFAMEQRGPFFAYKVGKVNQPQTRKGGVRGAHELLGCRRREREEHHCMLRQWQWMSAVAIA